MNLDIYKDIEEIRAALEHLGAKKILLQLPDGLKPEVYHYFNYLSANYNVVISSSPVYGACDIGPSSIYDKVDAIVQIGHSPMPNVKYPKPTIFVEHHYNARISNIDTSLLEGKYDRIGLLFSVQYKEVADEVRKIFENKGFTVIIGKKDGRMAYDGQVLGCNFSSVHSISYDVDAYVLVSTGQFHGIGAQLSTEREVFVLDLNDYKLHSMKDEADKFIRKRYAQIFRAKEARKICIISDTRIGQRRERLARIILRQVQQMGLEGILAVTDNISNQDLENMRCDAVVYTGCPRVPIDDQQKFTMPLLTPAEFEMGFVKNSNRYVLDEIVSVDDPADK
ncbi:diphthamide biosynthesis enzyme Dph2 [Thermoplasma volcanium]|nr:diphthamide biosynthesis enzyme Dph2 [Thermoplasma volcanium]